MDFLKIFLAVALAALSVVVASKILKTGDLLSSNFTKSTNEAALSFEYEKLEALDTYGKPVPIASIYQVLNQNIDSLSDLTISYYVVDDHDNYVETSPQHYDFTRGGYNSTGDLLSPTDFRQYIIDQMRYLFAEQGEVTCERLDNEMYSITIKQYPREYRTTYVKGD